MADIKHTQKPLSVEEELILILQRRGCSVLFRRTYESCQSAVYYYAGDLSDLYDFSSAAWFWRNDNEDISLSGVRIFYLVSDVCGDYFHVLF